MAKKKIENKKTTEAWGIDRDITHMRALVKSDGRYYLDGILIHGDKAAATDGHFLVETDLRSISKDVHLIHVSESPAPIEIVIPSHAIRSAEPGTYRKDHALARDFLTVRRETEGEKTFGVLSGVDKNNNRMDVTFFDQGPKFPKYPKVLKQAQESKKLGKIGVSAKLLKKLLIFLTKCGVDRLVIHVPKEENSPFYIEAKNSRRKFRICLMPRSLS